ncbi:hypothetical protein E8E14_013878 [Neopestalotiopsis sp. 37M]|nr:hypothetical protein E8E14_013878 [Neopestalotiopsis sp. 37M]
MGSFHLLDLPVELIRIICSKSLMPHYPLRELFVDVLRDRKGARDLCNLSQTCRMMNDITKPIIASYLDAKLPGLEFEYLPYACRIVSDSELAARETFMYVQSYHNIGLPEPGNEAMLLPIADHIGIKRLWFPWQPEVYSTLPASPLAPQQQRETTGLHVSQVALKSMLLEVMLLHMPSLSQLSLPQELQFRELPPGSLPNIRMLALRSCSKRFPESRIGANSLDGTSNLINAACNLQELYVEDIDNAVKELSLRNLESLTITRSILTESTLAHIVSSCRKLRSLYYEPAAEVDIPCAFELNLYHEHPAALIKALEPVYATLENLRLRIPEWDDSNRELENDAPLWLISGTDLEPFERLQTLEVSAPALSFGDDALVELIPLRLEFFTLTNAGPEWLIPIRNFINARRGGMFPNLRTINIPKPAHG